MALKAAKRQTLIMATKVAAEHAAKRGELSAKLTKPQANRVMQAIGVSHGFSRVPYSFAVNELTAVWAKEYAASLKRKQPVTAQVKPAVATAKPKTRTKKQPKAAEVEQAPKEQPAQAEPKAQDDERLASLEAKFDKLAEMFTAFMATK